MSEPRTAIFGGIEYRVSFVDGGVVFMETTPIYGHACIMTVELRSGCWYVADSTRLPMLSTLSKMHAWLQENVGRDNTSAVLPTEWNSP